MRDIIRKTITLTLTRSCNLKCIYCYENHKSAESMSFDVAKNIVSRELEADDGFSEVEFDLFGGEPFIVFDLIKHITDYIIHYNTSKKVLIFIVTNGTLVHGEVQEWLRLNKRYVICGLSLDGTKEMTDLNRDGCFSKIDLDFFLEEYPEQSIKMTVSPLTISKLSEGVIFLQQKGFKVACNLAYNIDWSDESNKSYLERELRKLMEYYLLHPETKPIELIDRDISSIANEDDILLPFCGAGRAMKAYDVDGECYPCQFFMPLSVGEDRAREAQKMKFYRESIPRELWDEKCVDCVLKCLCPTCFGANYATSGNMYYHEDNYCRLTKITIKAQAYFKAVQLSKGLLDMDDSHKKALAKAILKVQENVDC